MSQENVESARRIIRGYHSRDVEDMLVPMHADIEWISAFTGLEGGGAYIGHEGFRRYFRDLYEQWSDFEVIGDEFISAGAKVVVPSRVKARGKASGVAIDTHITAVLEFSEGKVVRGRTFLDHAEALEAAGVSE